MSDDAIHMRCRDTASLVACSDVADGSGQRGAVATRSDAMALHDAEVAVVMLLAVAAGMVAAFQAESTTEYSSSQMC